MGSNLPAQAKALAIRRFAGFAAFAIGSIAVVVAVATHRAQAGLILATTFIVGFACGIAHDLAIAKIEDRFWSGLAKADLEDHELLEVLRWISIDFQPYLFRQRRVRYPTRHLVETAEARNLKSKHIQSLRGALAHWERRTGKI